MRTPRVLADRYELSRPLGSGGMGHVLSGTDRLLDRRVAVKILAPHLAQDERAVARFRREARSAAGLSHPSIVSVYDSGSENGWHYLVMEHVEGRTLGQVLREEGALHPRRAAEIATDLARALGDAHRAGIVHRDVKPGNVMLTSDGQVKVVDFGIAAAVSSETATETAAVLGTVSYMSPEQVQGRPADPRSDLYALGVVLFEMLTGRTPFVADTPLAVAYKQVEEDPVPPSSMNPDVPPALDAVVLRAMAKAPEERYPSAEALLEDLEAHPEDVDDPVTVAAGPLHQEPAAGRPGAGAHRAPRRRRWLVGAAAVVAVAAGVPTGLVVSSGGDDPTTPPGRQAPQAPDQGREPGDTDATPRSESTPSGSRDRDGSGDEDAQEPASKDSPPSSKADEEEDPEPSPSPSPTEEPSPSPSAEPSPTPSATPSP